jgi:hypothetical protein
VTRRIVGALVAVVALHAGCAKPPPPDAAVAPRLPAPSAGTYARLDAEPQDSVIGAVMGRRAWDASLSGAAAGLALSAVAGTGGLAAWEVRDAAWTAGWPYVVTEARGWTTAAGAQPPEELCQWIEQTDPDPLGVVRARGPAGDVWVALRGVARIELGVVPRTFPPGGSLVLPAVVGGRMAVADPEGRLWEAALEGPRQISLVAPGEWLVEIRDSQGVAALFPLYVGVRPPDHPLLYAAESGVEPSAHALALLSDARASFALAPWKHDPLLDSVARAVAGGRDDVATLVMAVGFPDDGASAWHCASTSVEGCLDRWLSDPRRRPVLLGPSTHVGISGTQNEQGQVRFTVIVARG